MGEGGGESGDGDAVASGVGYDQAPRELGAADLVCEPGVGEEAGQRGVGGVGVADAVQERGPDDAAGAPDGGPGGEVDVPVVGVAGGLYPVGKHSKSDRTKADANKRTR
ncbi:hypothetical protein GCM10022207_50930 [Streptomyces lannensis]|uniref:Uncharacterized protein n=1 Tax=Streptomyces lannensis TaxID=766498 RepID=A0ABP7KHW5_9ACTN